MPPCCKTVFSIRPHSNAGKYSPTKGTSRKDRCAAKQEADHSFYLLDFSDRLVPSMIHWALRNMALRRNPHERRQVHMDHSPVLCVHIWRVFDCIAARGCDRGTPSSQAEEHTKGQRGVSTAVYGIVKRSGVFLPNERMNQDLCFLPWQFAQ